MWDGLINMQAGQDKTSGLVHRLGRASFMDYFLLQWIMLSNVCGAFTVKRMRSIPGMT